jgi:hypothetical protein
MGLSETGHSLSQLRDQKEGKRHADVILPSNQNIVQTELKTLLMAVPYLCAALNFLSRPYCLKVSEAVVKK